MSVDNETDECVWYFINIVIDASLGIFLCFVLLIIVDKLARKKNVTDLHSGKYYEKVEKRGKTVYRLKKKMYFIQLGVWSIIVLVVNIA